MTVLDRIRATYGALSPDDPEHPDNPAYDPIRGRASVRAVCGKLTASGPCALPERHGGRCAPRSQETFPLPLPPPPPPAAPEGEVAVPPPHWSDRE